MRLIVFSTLWARAQGGEAVLRHEGGTAQEDLSWLGLVPERAELTSRRDRCQAIADDLVARGQAYPCFCTPAELREMYVQQATSDRPLRYDGRCRRLSQSDIEVLRKAGRSPCIRLLLPEGPHEVSDLNGHRTQVEAGELDDFKLMLPDGAPSDVFGDLLDDDEVGAERALWHASRRNDLAPRFVLARVLGIHPAPVAFLPDWTMADGRPPSAEGSVLTVSLLRAHGFHPKAIIRVAARAGWDPGDSLTIEEMAGSFRLEDVAAQTPPFEMAQLRAENAAVLQRVSEDDRVAAMVDHLERRGYPMAARDPRWQRRFVAAVLPELETLESAEAMAALLLTPTVDYDREVARTLREASTQRLITQFETAMKGVDGEDMESWRDVLTRFRAGVEAPGRALVTLRLVLTGQRNGPNLAALLSLLGIEGCRARIEKARRYAGS